MVITFSGLDGSGKSSLIAWLKADLEGHGRAVTVLHMNDHVGMYALLRAIRDRVKRWLGRAVSPPVPPGVADARAVRGTPVTGAPTSRVRAALSKARYVLIWNKPMRRILYVIDIIVFQGYRFWLERVKGRLLIMDRYFYDTLVDLSDERRLAWVGFLERLTPTPDLPVLLDVTPEESYARKGEYSIAYLRRRWNAYHTVFSRVGSAVIIANHNMGSTQMVLQQVASERLSAATRPRPEEHLV